MFYERRNKKKKIQKTSINVATYFFCRDTKELGSKFKGKFMSNHKSPLLRHKFKRTLKEMLKTYFSVSQHN